MCLSGCTKVFGIWGAVERLSYFLLAPGFGVGKWQLDKACEGPWHSRGYLNTSTKTAMLTETAMVKEIVVGRSRGGNKASFVLVSDLGGHLRGSGPVLSSGLAEKLTSPESARQV